jgi:hypothetical protein
VEDLSAVNDDGSGREMEMNYRGWIPCPATISVILCNPEAQPVFNW